MAKGKRFAFVLLGALLVWQLAACSSSPAIKRWAPSFSQNALFVFSPLFLKDYAPLPDKTDETIFENNLFIGRIDFSGGVITDPKKGVDVSKIRNFSAIDYLYEGRGSYLRKTPQPNVSLPELFAKLITDSVLDALATKDIAFKAAPQSLPADESLFTVTQGAPFAPDKKFARQDNINEPIIQWLIAPGGKLAATLQSALGATSGTALIPVVECAYVHGPGYFYDESSGCLSGMRIIVQFLAFDIATGTLLDNYRDDYRYIKAHYEDQDFLNGRPFTEQQQLYQQTLTTHLEKVF